MPVFKDEKQGQTQRGRARSGHVVFALTSLVAVAAGPAARALTLVGAAGREALPAVLTRPRAARVCEPNVKHVNVKTNVNMT